MHKIRVYNRDNFRIVMELFREPPGDAFKCFRLSLLHCQKSLFCSPSSQDYNIYDRVSHNIAMPFSTDSYENTFALGDFNSHQLNYNVNFSVTRCLNEIVEQLNQLNNGYPYTFP